MKKGLCITTFGNPLIVHKNKKSTLFWSAYHIYSTSSIGFIRRWSDIRVGFIDV